MMYPVWRLEESLVARQGTYIINRVHAYGTYKIRRPRARHAPAVRQQRRKYRVPALPLLTEATFLRGQLEDDDDGDDD
jgi:hypothetical protein